MYTWVPSPSYIDVQKKGDYFKKKTNKPFGNLAWELSLSNSVICCWMSVWVSIARVFDRVSLTALEIILLNSYNLAVPWSYVTIIDTNHCYLLSETSYKISLTVCKILSYTTVFVTAGMISLDYLKIIMYNLNNFAVGLLGSHLE